MYCETPATARTWDAGSFDSARDYDGPPAQGMREVFADQKKELDRQEGEMKKTVKGDLAALNGLARKLDLPHILAVSK